MSKKEKIYELKRLDAFRVFKTASLWLALIIGLVGLVYCLITLIGGKYTQFGGAVLGTLFGVLILSPIYGAALALLCAAYNFVAAKVGGYRLILDVEEKE